MDYQTAFTNIRRAPAPDAGGLGGGKHRASGSYCGAGDAHAVRDHEGYAVCGEPVIWRPTPREPWPPASGPRCSACQYAVGTLERQ